MNIKADKKFRLIILECKICLNPLAIVCVYFPTKDKPTQQVDFLSYFKSMVYDYVGKNLLICLNLKHDIKGGNREIESCCVKDLKFFMKK